MHTERLPRDKKEHAVDESDGPPPADWKTLERQVLLSRPPWLEVCQEKIGLPGGRVVEDFYRVVLPSFAIVAAATEKGLLVTLRSFKQGLGRVILNLPSGVIEPGETPLEAARRELLEETGYAAREFVPLGSYVVDGNRQCGTMHAFLARGARRVQAPRPDDMEASRVELLPPQRMAEALLNGECPHLPSAGAFGLAVLGGLSLTDIR